MFSKKLFFFQTDYDHMITSSIKITQSLTYLNWEINAHGDHDYPLKKKMFTHCTIHRYIY